MEIKVYVSGNCVWSRDVCGILDKNRLAYRTVDVGNDRAAFEEMCRKSGQVHTPCVEIDSIMLADVSGLDVENYLLSREIIKRPAHVESKISPENDMSPCCGYIDGVRLSSSTRFF